MTAVVLAVDFENAPAAHLRRSRQRYQVFSPNYQDRKPIRRHVEDIAKANLPVQKGSAMVKTTLTAIALAAAVISNANADPSMFEQGRQDRAAWEQWFNSLQGDYKTGAFYWSSQRSLPNPGSCKKMNDQFYAGCTQAKVKLSASDALRKTEPDYKTGWNAWTPSYVTAPAVAAPPPAPAAPALAQPAAEPMETLPTTATTSVTWYIGHLGAETCVPLRDIGEGMERVYYGSGSMNTPEDVAARFRRMGAQTTRWVDAGEAVRQYTRILHTSGYGFDTYIPMFNNKIVCDMAISMIEK